MKHRISNEYLSICIDEHGAEMTSLIRKSDRMEFLWQGDQQYWAGHSPILFPTIGRCFNDVISHEGKLFPMPKHGLIKDLDFKVYLHKGNELILYIDDTQETHQHYPFQFRFYAGFLLNGNSLIITFEVENKSAQAMPFHLGAHPALNLPAFDKHDEVHGYIGFDHMEELVSNGLKPGGYLWPEGSFQIPLDKGHLLPLSNETFLCDTILDSRGITQQCTLYTKHKEAIIKVLFDSPILAMWAPQGGMAPFVCIEPWWGCCDVIGYEGDIANRPWTNMVAPNKTEKLSYTITIL